MYWLHIFRLLLITFPGLTTLALRSCVLCFCTILQKTRLMCEVLTENTRNIFLKIQDMEPYPEGTAEEEDKKTTQAIKSMKEASKDPMPSMLLW